MTSPSIAIALAAMYAALLVGIAALSAKRTHTAVEFFLAGRKLSAPVAGLSSQGSASSTSLLLGLGAAAYSWGLCAIWFAVALIGGAMLNWLLIAPRLRALTLVQNSLSLNQVFATDAGERAYRRVAFSAAAIVFLLLLLNSSALLRIAGLGMTRSLHWPFSSTLVVGMILVLAYTVVGGLRAISTFGAIQAILLLLSMLVLASAAVIDVGGLGSLLVGLKSLPLAEGDWLGNRVGVVALAFVLGLFGVGMGSPGFPHVVNRHMAIREAAQVRSAAMVALAWMLCMVVLTLAVGWSAKILITDLAANADPLMSLANGVMPHWLATVVMMIAFVSIVSSVDAQLLQMTSALAVDLRTPGTEPSVEFGRVVMPLLAALIVALTLYVPQDPYERMAFAGHALGAAFGPLLLVRVTGKRVRSGSMLGAIWAGFLLTLIFHAMPDAPGDFLETVLPFVASLGIALTGGERRHNPDRADRGAMTVHDRMPI